MEILKPPATHVVALSFDGKLTETDFDKVVEQIDAALESQERINVICDLTRLTGITPKALIKDILYGLSTFGRMYRFQRLAVVTDSPALESIVKFEDRIFSDIDIKSFPSEQRDQALSWIEARIEIPPPGLTLLEVESDNLLRIECGIEITGYDVRRVAHLIKKRYEQHGPVNLLVTLSQTPRFGPGLYYEKLKAFSALPMLNKYALVGPPWVRNWTNTVGIAVATRIRHFSDDEAALAWISDCTPTIEHLPSERPHVLALRLSGKVGDREVQGLYHLVLPYLKGDKEIDIFLELAYQEGMSLKGLFEALKLGIKHFSELSKGVRRMAVITDSRWLSKLVDLENLLLPGVEERPFSFAQKELALAWLHEGRQESRDGGLEPLPTVQ
jgi:hypothetical protein